MAFILQYIGKFIIPTDEVIFFRGVGIPPTGIYIYIYLYDYIYNYIYILYAYCLGVPITQILASKLGPTIHKPSKMKRSSAFRVSAGHRRLLRARGIPCSRWRKSRLIVSGVWAQCLHGAETCPVPFSVLKRLRTQAGRVASLAKPGVSPWLACSVGATQTVDPAFCLLLQRIRLFRLMWRDFPQARRRMQRGLVSLRCGNGGVSYLLARQLRSLEWLPVGLEVQDDLGRFFHLVETPLKAVRRVLESSWMDQVARNVSHRKSCGQVGKLDLGLSRTWMKYPLAEQSLLLVQCTGVTYTRDCLSHAVGLEVSRACPLCGMDDSRLHRAKFCEAVADLRPLFWHRWVPVTCRSTPGPMGCGTSRPRCAVGRPTPAVWVGLWR